jgi:hypothetical protein
MKSEDYLELPETFDNYIDVELPADVMGSIRRI